METIMTKRILAISMIFVCTAIAWFILSATLFDRSNDSRTVHLKESVSSTWGVAQDQHALHAQYPKEITKEEEETTDGKTIKKIKHHIVDVPIPLDASKIDVKLELA